MPRQVRAGQPHRQPALSHSTGDFPNILANTLHKVLLPGYEEEESTHESFTIEREVKDFREVKLNQLGRVGVPPRVMEGAEYTYGTFGEKTPETLRAFSMAC